MKTKEYHFSSATGVCEIYGSTYTPDDEEIKAVVVIHHGMAEHKQRYNDFIEYLTSNGYAVYMNDMANHGKSNQDKSITGYFGDKDGYKALAEDFNTTVEKAKMENPDKKLVIMGHSMGSFVVRYYTAQYPNAGYVGAIYMGTGGSNPAASAGDKLSSLVAKIKGTRYKSKMLDKITFGSYNNKFEKRTDFDWLTRDNEIVDNYIDDEYCGFLFSVQGMNDLVKLNIATNSCQWYERVPKDLKILLISGDMDPVGAYGKGIMEIDERLAETGHGSVVTKLYPQCRHEILNELNREQVYEDIKKFLDMVTQNN